ncbi:MAG: FkbM family methyltransferase [Anaerolineae bacterium]
MANIQLSHWLSFSEYWTFRDGMPRSERELLRRLLLRSESAKTVAFDVGANIGLFTCALAGFEAYQVHAFEPIPQTFCRLQMNVRDNGLLGSCVLNCLAVGASRDLVEFQFDERSAATSRMVSNRGTGTSLSSRQSVAVISLDEYCELKGVDYIDFLKIDVEGMEPYVLQGAQRLLRERRIASILIEICPANLRSVGLTVDSLAHEISASGYLPYELLDDGRAGRRLGKDDLEVMVLDNILLLPA